MLRLKACSRPRTLVYASAIPRIIDPVTVKVITNAINKLPKFGPLSRRIQQHNQRTSFRFLAHSALTKGNKGHPGGAFTLPALTLTAVNF